MSWCHASGKNTRVSCRVTPRAARTEVAGIHDSALRIRLQAPPVDGRANRTLVKFLAKQVGIPASRITLLSGETSRLKRLELADIAPDEVRRALQ